MKKLKEKRDTFEVEKEVRINENIILEKGDKIVLIKENSNLDDIANDAVYDADKWLGDDQDEMDDFFHMNDNEKEDFIDEHLDDFYDWYLQDGQNYVDINRINRKQLIKLIVDKM